MKLFDRVLGLSPEAAVPGNPQYEHYRTNLRRFQVGAGLVVSGAIAKMVGVDIGEVAGVDAAEAVSTTAMIAGSAGAYITGFMVASDAFELVRPVR